MNSEELPWTERLTAAFFVLLGMLATYWKYWRHKPPMVKTEEKKQKESLQKEVVHNIEEKREEFVSTSEVKVKELVQEVKENSKDAETAAKALEKFQL